VRALAQTDMFCHARIPKNEHPQKTTTFLGDDSFYACLNPEFSKLSTPLHRLNRKNVFSDYELCEHITVPPEYMI